MTNHPTQGLQDMTLDLSRYSDSGLKELQARIVEEKTKRGLKMTNMPDKIYAYQSERDGKIWYPTDKWSSFAIEYTRSDLIPQPVADEARAKALDDAINEWRVYQETYHAGYGVASTTILVDKIIKAALSQPVPAQPEAIQKAVEALTKNELAAFSLVRNRKNGSRVFCYQGSTGTYNLAFSQAQVRTDFLSAVRKIQSELEALKAENVNLSMHLDGCRGVLAETEERERALIDERDELRRAVVDMYDWMDNECDYRTQSYFRAKYNTIATKAKAVKDV